MVVTTDERTDFFRGFRLGVINNADRSTRTYEINKAN